MPTEIFLEFDGLKTRIRINAVLDAIKSTELSGKLNFGLKNCF
jgi:hypothetical protein